MNHKLSLTDDPITRWWWVRHAPVTENQGRLYGSSDIPAEINNPIVFKALAKLLPSKAICVRSNLQRTQQTLSAIFAAGLTASEPTIEPNLAEQNFGNWHGHLYTAIPALAAPHHHRFWFTTVQNRPPGGESYLDLISRVTEVIERLTLKHSGQDIIAVAHGGTIRAALGHALGLDPTDYHSFETDNLSVTRIDHEPGPGPERPWRIKYTNLVPRW
jgi:broad specificity phosphatase PhoE